MLLRLVYEANGIRGTCKELGAKENVIGFKVETEGEFGMVQSSQMVFACFRFLPQRFDHSIFS